MNSVLGGQRRALVSGDDRLAVARPDGAALDATLAALGDRVGPVAPARDRILPVADRFADLFVEGGLVRGRTLACTGAAATSLALALVAPTIAAGSWLVTVDIPTIGLDAAGELGVPLERVVAITRDRCRGDRSDGDRSDGDRSDGDRDSRWSQRWPEVMAAAIDGFGVVLATVPDGVRAGEVRKVAVRVQRHGALVVVLGDPGPFGIDGVVHSESVRWSGLGNGHGHLRQRSVTVQTSGRRLPGRCRRSMLLPS